MDYPANFPVILEPFLLQILHRVEGQLKSQNPTTVDEFDRQIKRAIKKNGPKSLNGRYPNLWWLRFVLLRHRKEFGSTFTEMIRPLLTKTRIRSLSGIVPVALFTGGVGCQYDCVYCPKQPNMPKSYFADEPAVMRAARNHFDPFNQTKNRLIALTLSGHPIDKIELIVKGGTFSSYSRQDRTNFVTRVYDAANQPINQLADGVNLRDTKSVSLDSAQKHNENASSRIIGMVVETRPDMISSHELLFLRQLGVTHIELGVQALDDSILRMVNRGHNVATVIRATRLLKDAGFKVSYHLMPNLPGSSPTKDLILLRKVFNPDFSPDHVKVYPTVVSRYSQLEEWYKNGRYKPYNQDALIDVLTDFKSTVVPEWVRISRLGRDITDAMMPGPKIRSDIRMLVGERLKSQGLSCRCIRCREIKGAKPFGKIRIQNVTYKASGGTEYFIQAIDKADHLLGFIRLRIPTRPLFQSLNGCSLVRELHVYGQVVPLGRHDGSQSQHRGLGVRLLRTAEKITVDQNMNKIAVISGVGVRGYYRKQGYSLKDTYMVKKLGKSIETLIGDRVKLKIRLKYRQCYADKHSAG